MDIYQFFWTALAWTMTVAVLWPANVPLAALAFRIWQGQKPVDMDRGEMWMRSALGALVVAVVGVVFVALDYALWAWAELPAGPVHLVVFVGFLAAAVYVMMQFFEIEDFFQAFSLILIYLYIPVFALWLLNWPIGFWNPLVNFAKGWLQEPRV
jgi:hypothetical protein